MRRLRRLAALAALAGAVGCASPTPRWDVVDASRVYPVSDLDRSPELLGCGAYTPPVRAWARYRVVVSFVVTAAGDVEAGSPMVVPQGGRRRSDQADQAALAAAASCTFEPGLRRDTPVRVRLRRVFLFDMV